MGKCGCHDRSFSGILGPRLFLSPDNTYKNSHNFVTERHLAYYIIKFVSLPYSEYFASWDLNLGAQNYQVDVVC